MADVRGDLRASIDRVLGGAEAESDSPLDRIVRAALSLTRRERHLLQCSRCRKESYFDVHVSDPKASVRAFAELLDQAHGKPAESRNVQVDVNVRREELASLSDERLLELAAAEPADWEPA